MSLWNFLKYNRYKKLTISSYLYSAVFRFLILTVKPSILHKYWGEEGKESPEKDTLENYRYAKKVSYAVNRVCNKTAWESKCLVRALTAQRLLKKKHIATTLYLGCALEDGKMIAHAWIRCGEFYVTGGNGEGYAVVDRFCCE